VVRRGSYLPDAGHLIKLNFDPKAGHEQAGWRPAIVLTPAAYNRKTGLAILAPITHQAKGYPFEVALPEGLAISGVILSDHLKNLDWRARKARYEDRAPASVLNEVLDKVALLLNLKS
jgi:mRNA interferase MazF